MNYIIIHYPFFINKISRHFIKKFSDTLEDSRKKFKVIVIVDSNLEGKSILSILEASDFRYPIFSVFPGKIQFLYRTNNDTMKVSETSFINALDLVITTFDIKKEHNVLVISDQIPRGYQRDGIVISTSSQSLFTKFSRLFKEKNFKKVNMETNCNFESIDEIKENMVFKRAISNAFKYYTFEKTFGGRGIMKDLSIFDHNTADVRIITDISQINNEFILSNKKPDDEEFINKKFRTFNMGNTYVRDPRFGDSNIIWAIYEISKSKLVKNRVIKLHALNSLESLKVLEPEFKERFLIRTKEQEI